MGNSKVDEFKMFVKANPFLIDYIKKGKKSWQDLYEIYDIYGSDEEYWNKYLEETKQDNDKNNAERNNSTFTNHVDELIKMAKNVDVDKVQEGITSLQKTLALFGDLFASKKPTSTYNPRPLYKRFDD